MGQSHIWNLFTSLKIEPSVNTLCPVTFGSSLVKDVIGRPYQMAFKVPMHFAIFFDLYSIVTNPKNY